METKKFFFELKKTSSLRAPLCRRCYSVPLNENDKVQAKDIFFLISDSSETFTVFHVPKSSWYLMNYNQSTSLNLLKRGLLQLI